MLIDTHAHLDFDKFDQDREEVIKRAFDNGVEKIINVGCNFESSKASIDLANKHENIWAAVGVHPSEANPSPALPLSGEGDVRKYITEKLRELIQNFQKIVAVGEIGLDYYWMESPKELQIEALKRQLELAKDFDLPVIIHCRNSKDEKMNAYEDCLVILEKEKIVKAVFHCYSGTTDFAEKVWQKGYLTSFTGAVTYPNALARQDVVKKCPEELFMIETDCPFLAPVFVPPSSRGGTTPGKPQKYRGQRNEPSFVAEVARKVAEIRGVNSEDIEKLTTKNAEVFFRI